jgi:hypothetical protein
LHEISRRDSSSCPQTSAVRGGASVVELVDEVVLEAKNTLAVHRVDDLLAIGVSHAGDLDEVGHPAGEQHHRGEHAGNHSVGEVVLTTTTATVVSITVISLFGIGRVPPSV